MSDNLIKINKKAKVKALVDLCNGAKSALLVNLQGIDASSISVVRKELFDNEVNMVQLKNSLARIALKETEFGDLVDNVEGYLALVLSKKHPALGAKILKKLKDSNADKLEFKSFIVENKLYQGDKIDFLINIPTKDEAITKFALCLKFPILKLILVLKALQKAREESSSKE